jgi:hypothetical protein
MMSPFQYGGNNPVRFIDINGDSLNLSLLQKYDNQNGTNYLSQLLGDLQTQTGLTYNVSSNGQLEYLKDALGNEIVSTTMDKNGNSIDVGSKEARDLMLSNIKNQNVVYAKITAINSSAPNGGKLINLNIKQINSFIKGAVNVDSKTLGWGMTFMHESLHSILGNGMRDSPLAAGFGPIGDVEIKMNIIRNELNQKGYNYGQRSSYQGLVPGYSTFAILPFDSWSKRHLINGLYLHWQSKYIKYEP